MNLLTSPIRPAYCSYLSAAFGSAFITSVYSVVDMAVVGQYHGPAGTAALAVIAPVWNVIYSLGLLMGIGGAVIFTMLRGQSSEEQVENEYFTASVFGSFILAGLSWIGLCLYEEPIFQFFGANAALLPLCHSYIMPIQWIFPLFLFNQMLAAFLRNDNHPKLAAMGVLAGGIFNMAGDYLFVFPLGMGIFGAGLATAIGSVLSFLIMMTHFRSAVNTLHLRMPRHIWYKWKEIIVVGFSTFFIDIAMAFWRFFSIAKS